MSLSVFLWIHVQTVLLVLGLTCLLPRALPPFQLAGLSLPLAALCVFLPFKLPALLFAHMGLISLPGLALLLDTFLRRVSTGRVELLPGLQRPLLLTACALMALFLYPMALGLGVHDPYALGFSQGPLFLLLGLAAILAWWLGHRVIALLLLVSLWTWQLQWGESGNLWDYMLDAWTGLAALWWCLARLPGAISHRMGKT